MSGSVVLVPLRFGVDEAIVLYDDAGRASTVKLSSLLIGKGGANLKWISGTYGCRAVLSEEGDPCVELSRASAETLDAARAAAEVLLEDLETLRRSAQGVAERAGALRSSLEFVEWYGSATAQEREESREVIVQQLVEHYQTA